MRGPLRPGGLLVPRPQTPYLVFPDRGCVHRDAGRGVSLHGLCFGSSHARAVSGARVRDRVERVEGRAGSLPGTHATSQRSLVGS